MYVFVCVIRMLDWAGEYVTEDKEKQGARYCTMQLETLTSRWHTCQETCFTAHKNCSGALQISWHSRKSGEKMHIYIFGFFGNP